MGEGGKIWKFEEKKGTFNFVFYPKRMWF